MIQVSEKTLRRGERMEYERGAILSKDMEDVNRFLLAHRVPNQQSALPFRPYSSAGSPCHAHSHEPRTISIETYQNSTPLSTLSCLQTIERISHRIALRKTCCSSTALSDNFFCNVRSPDWLSYVWNVWANPGSTEKCCLISSGMVSYSRRAAST